MDGIHRFYLNQHYDRITLAAGVVQLMFYCDFFLRDLPLKGELRNSNDNCENVIENGGEQQQQPSEIYVSIVDNKYLKEQEALRSAQQTAMNEAKFNNLNEVVLTPAELTKDDKVRVQG